MAAKKKKAPPPLYTRYYYAGTSKFEQSLDVYHPSTRSSNNNTVVLFVVGCGWLGHVTVLSRIFSWWNASMGPHLAFGGHCTAVIVRHRGGFVTVPSLFGVLCYSGLLFGYVSIWDWQVAIGVVLIYMMGCALVARLGRGRATLDDMLDDVATALLWVKEHRVALHSRNNDKTTLGRTDTASTSSSSHSTASSNSGPSQSDSKPKIIVGGYSSGAHVLATLLQRPDRLRAHRLSKPEIFLSGVVYVSGLLATSPTSQTARHTWVTRFILGAVWGSSSHKAVPSPLEGVLPDIPHLLIANRYETFGLPLVDLFFSSAAYAAKLQKLGIVHKLLYVNSNHWSILNSDPLRRLLQAELPKLAAPVLSMQALRPTRVKL